ncbi:hypothetical protein DRO47_02860, partial [Candidatus Bathyarchaeota archaeon]
MEDIILEFKKKYWKRIKRRANVHGFSSMLHPRIKDGKEVPGTKCIRIYVEKKVPACQLSPKDLIPRALDLGGSIVEIDVVELPRMRYLDEPEDRTTPIDHQKRYRPVQAGTSCMHKNGTACIAKGTLIYANNSVMPIEEISSGRSIYSFDGHSVSKDRAIALIPQGKKRIIEIATQRRTIRVTPDHKFLKLTEDASRDNLRNSALEMFHSGFSIYRIAKD